MATTQKRQIIFTTWYLVRELSHAIATILAADHVIADRSTPSNCCAYGLAEYVGIFLGSDNKEYLSGERGFYMESQLGGIMKAKKVSETDWSISYLILEIGGILISCLPSNGQSSIAMGWAGFHALATYRTLS